MKDEDRFAALGAQALNEAERESVVRLACEHPQVILQKALAYNAGAVIFWHNHPSGTVEPSPSDMQLTSRTKDLLEEVDVRLLDHIVVSRSETVSMAARGLVCRRSLPARRAVARRQLIRGPAGAPAVRRRCGSRAAVRRTG